MQSHDDYIVVIPARYDSSRLPGKPLIKISGIEMLLRTFNRCKEVVDAKKIFVATDNLMIEDFCISNNIQVVMTSDKCLTGTDRVAEVSKKIYGIATKEDLKELKEEGIETEVIPWIEDNTN